MRVKEIVWYDKESDTNITRIVIASVAILDSPDRADAQSMKQYNGKYGCTYCENPGQTCHTLSGHKHVYQYKNAPYHTKERMIFQPYQARR